MQLNKFKAVAKARNPWQAIDLGFVMARAWYMQLLALWAVPAGLLYLLLMILLYDSPVLAAIIVWWLKPVWERPILHVVSRQLFDNHVPTGEVFKTYFSIVKFDLLLWLSWRRFSPYRAFDMPVTQLEQLKGRARIARLNLLHARFSGPASWLLITCAHVEAFLMLGLAAGFALLVPQGVNPNWSLWLMDNSNAVSHGYNVLWLSCAALVAPFYVCSGFSLYLQRRIDLEAWDIEIQFRRLLLRKNTRKSSLTITSLMLMCIGFCALSVFSPTVDAQNHESFATSVDEIRMAAAAEKVDEQPKDLPLSSAKQAARDAVDEIFASEDFSRLEQRSGYRFIPQQKTEDELIPEWMISLAEWAEGKGGAFAALGKASLWLAKFLEVILWGLAASLVLIVMYYYRKSIVRLLHYREQAEGLQSTAPKTLFGLDITQENLPQDVVDAAQQSWAAGNHRLALALLMRGSIVKFIELRCDFANGNTENECALIVRRTLAAAYSDYFFRLVGQWQTVAYAHGNCPPEAFASLCVAWREVFYSE